MKIPDLKKHLHSFSARIFVMFCLFSILILILANSVTYQFSNRQLMKKAEDSLSVTMNQNANLIHNLIDRIDEIMLAPSNDQLLYQTLLLTPEEMSPTVLRDSIRSYFINTIQIPLQRHLAHFDYHVYFSASLPAASLYQTMLSDPHLHPETPVLGEDWFIRTQNSNGSLYWYTLPEQPGKIYVARQIRGFYSPFTTTNVAVLKLELDISDFFALISGFSDAPGSGHYFVETNGAVHPLNSGLPSLSSADGLWPEESGSFTTVTLGTIRYLLGASILSNGWKLVQITPVKEILIDNRTVITFFIIVTLLCILFSVLFSLYAARRIAHPIRALSHTMLETVKNRTLDIEYQNTSDINEISDLYDSYRALITRINELLIEVYTKGVDMKESEIKALQAQINPHFLYNTLDSVCWAIMETGNLEIPTVITGLSNLLRYSLKNFDKLATVTEELEIVSRYIEIQQFCYSLDIRLVTEFASVSNEYKMPKLTLQPLVENAILHGMVEHGRDSGDITIRAYYQCGDVVIQVENDCDADIGKMYSIINDTSETDKHGIKNVHNRLTMLFGPEYGLNFHRSEGGGLVVELKLPG